MLRKWIPTLAASAAVLMVMPLEARTPAVTAGPDENLVVRVTNDFRWQVTVELITSDGRKLDLGPVAAGSGLVVQVGESVLNGTEGMRLRVLSSRRSRNTLSEPLMTDDTVESRPFAAEPGAVVELRVGQELSATQVLVHRG